MAGYPWGGYRNGRIPLSEMALYRGCLGRADAVRQAYALQAAYMKAFPGRQLVVLEVYRDFTRQQKLRNLYLTGNGNPAAVPGNSIHGWGLAFDFAAPLNSFGSAEHRWMRQNAPLYGFDNARGKADGEAWHWEYGNVPVTHWASLDITEIEDDMEYIKWSEASKDAFFNDFLYRRGMENYKGESVPFGIITREIERTLVKILDSVTRGITDVKPDGDIYEQARLSQERTYQLIQMVNALGTLKFTDAQLATIGSGVKPVDEDKLVAKIVNGIKALFGKAAA